ncbi:spore germination protein [Kroppenstedtia eburnea]|uniref:Spore germination protein gerPA/gerPF n=1 Tax=Kroppenstedtia eburnea TaxID=714067 RepID=A0A1N7PR65_9BACL|nr:spore germination protein [Kroppenstedtia eburnea]QKI82698.1 spore gernimation protein [Kroppenstedtia eburnea]SIT13143.1 Spore germination protein gerPA/gerPF [Kroppenstedtia eburnea]
MAVANQIFNAKLLNVSQTGNINIGDCVNVGKHFNVKNLGGSSPVGDFAANIQGGANQFIDPDVIDQV